MDSDLLFSNISRHIDLSKEDRSYVTEQFEECSLKKNDFILRQGEACHTINFIKEGTLRAFFTNAQGKESTLMFAVKDWWITDMHCFLNELPAMLSIQALESSTVLKLPKKNLDALFDTIPSFNKFFRILIQNAYCREQLRSIQNLSLSAEQRYKSFINKYPQIAGKVPLKHIASYLGITPEFLSTIRAAKN